MQNPADSQKPQAETPQDATPRQTPGQADAPTRQPVEREIDLNAVFPDEKGDLNALFPDADMKRLLKKISHNKKDIQTMTRNFAEENTTDEAEPQS